MKLSVIPLCLAVEALAHDAFPLPKRDLATITDVLDNVKASIRKLDTAVSTASDPGPLLLASNGLISALKTGASRVNGTTPIDFLDSVRLIRPVHELTALGQGLTGNLKSMKAKVKKLGLCDVTLLQITTINTRAQDLINAVDGKIPPEAQEISRHLTSDLTKVLRQSKEEFSGQNCTMASDAAVSSRSASLSDGRSIIVGFAAVLFASAILI
ncbi:hypothetical protein C2857_000299 [Epichloe festucae Fl1]|uniref:Cell wall galactomannoprotein n=1 Tax=Epichloe festucae (strain Fl1) TaxID=877507 RepID=A0A7S9KN23_EPIFF|nr:hypothetical protein C2857_000299 [Epichloe festucae Fl1]